MKRGILQFHIHSARSRRTDNSKSIREVTIVSEIIHLIEQELAIDIHDDKNSLSYSRLVNHLRLFIHRFQQNQYAVLDEEILEVVKKKYAESYVKSQKSTSLINEKFSLSSTK